MAERVDIREVYEAFLAGCRGVRPRLVSHAQKLGIRPEVIEACGARYYTHDYAQLNAQLQQRFGLQALIAAGMVRLTAEPVHTRMGVDEDAPLPLPGQVSQTRGVFHPYHQAKVPYLVLPYMQQGRPIYLKARPLAGDDRCQRMKLPPMLATANMPPCLFNADVLTATKRVVLFYRELDALLAVSMGLPAVACAGFLHFRTSWMNQLAGKRVWLVVDAAGRGSPRVAMVLRLFEAANQPAPVQVLVQPGQELAEALLPLVAEGQGREGSLMESAVRLMMPRNENQGGV